MKLLNRITQSYEEIASDSLLINGLHSSFNEHDLLLPLVRGSNESRTINQFKISFIGELLSTEIKNRFALLAEAIKKNPNKFVSGEISSLIFFENAEILKISRLEKELYNNIYHLEEVCYRPTLDLKLTEYKTPVSRARRVTPRALSYLSGHSEDWHNQTFVGVKPARVIALHREDQWDIYENLATKNLIDYLNTHISQRLQTLSELDNAFEELCSFFYDQNGGVVTENYMFRLHKHFDDDGSKILEHQSLLEETKQTLEILQKKLQSLMGTQLYREVGNKKIPLQLQFTNLLQNHQHYRYITIFWRFWLEEKNNNILPEEEIIAEQEQLCINLESYMKLLIINVLIELRFKNSENGVVYRRNNGDGIQLSVKHGVITLSSEYRDDLQFFILPFDISLIDKAKLPNVSSNMILIYPTSDSSIDISKPDCYTFNIKNNAHLYYVPISTFSLYSQEQIAAILERWVIQSLNNKYPQQIQKVSTNMQKFIKTKGDLFNNAVNISANNAKVTGQQKGDFEKEWLHYHQSQFTYKNKISKEDQMVQKFTSAFGLIEKIKECPVCGELSHTFKGADNGTFHCTCYQCKSEWFKDGKNSIIKLNTDSEKNFKNYARFNIE